MSQVGIILKLTSSYTTTDAGELSPGNYVLYADELGIATLTGEPGFEQVGSSVTINAADKFGLLGEGISAGYFLNIYQGDLDGITGLDGGNSDPTNYLVFGPVPVDVVNIDGAPKGIVYGQGGSDSIGATTTTGSVVSGTWSLSKSDLNYIFGEVAAHVDGEYTVEYDPGVSIKIKDADGDTVGTATLSTEASIYNNAKSIVFGDALVFDVVGDATNGYSIANNLTENEIFTLGEMQPLSTYDNLTVLQSEGVTVNVAMVMDPDSQVTVSHLVADSLMPAQDDAGFSEVFWYDDLQVYTFTESNVTALDGFVSITSTKNYALDIVNSKLIVVEPDLSTDLDPNDYQPVSPTEEITLSDAQLNAVLGQIDAANSTVANVGYVPAMVGGDAGADEPLSATASADGTTLTITIHDPSITTKTLADDAIYVDGEKLSTLSGTFTAAGGTSDATYTITGSGFNVGTVIGFDDDGSGTLDGDEFTTNPFVESIGDGAGDGDGPRPVYSLTTADGVPVDGLYVFESDGETTETFTAMRVIGNDQQGYAVDAANSTETFSNLSQFDTAEVVGNIAYEIVELTAEDLATLQIDTTGFAAGNYLVKPTSTGTAGNIDLYSVSGDGITERFAVALEPSLSDFDVQSLELTNFEPTAIGGLSSEGSGIGQINFDDMFEIVQLERSGNIIEYGVKLLPDAFEGESITLSNFYFNVGWDQKDANSGAYSYWDQFTPANGAPVLALNSDVQTKIINGETPAAGTYFAEYSDGLGLSFASFDNGGMEFKSGDLIATFMLTKNQSWPENYLYLDTAQYSLYDAHDTFNTPDLIAANYSRADDDFFFSFAPHPFTAKVKTASGEVLPNVEIFETDVSVNDGLSLVPVMKFGNIVKYQVVMNIPKPIFYSAETDNTVQINGNQSIEITGAEIFNESILWLTNSVEAGSQAADLLASVDPETNLKYYLGGSITPATNKFAGVNYTGHEFVDVLLAAQEGNLASLKTSSTLEIDVVGMQLPDVSGANAEGRYVMAEFFAVDTGSDGLAITYRTGASDSIEASGSSHNVYRAFDETSASASIDGWTETINDGAELVVLADGLYSNQRMYNDAIGAEDALGALRISKATAKMAAEQFYSKSEIVAADFNLDGKVSAADAYDILQYAVNGPAPNSPMAKWVFIDDIEGSTGDSANVTARPDAVAYDGITDTFIGKDNQVVDATAVLLGDVTSSYSNVFDRFMQPDINMTLNVLGDFVADGLNNKNIVLTEPMTGTSNQFTATATSDDLVLLAEDTGIHIINANPIGEEPFGMIDVVLSNYDALDALYDGDDGVTTSGADVYFLNYDTSETETGKNVAPDINAVIKAVEDYFDNFALDGSGNPIYDFVTLRWSNLDTADNADPDLNSVVAFDLNHNGTFEAGSDLLVWVQDAPFDFVGDPSDPGTYYHAGLTYDSLL